MGKIAWQAEHSVESVAGLDFVWAYMTDVANWDDPPAQFRFDGPFETGGLGVTEIPGQPPRQWQVRDVRPNESYRIEFALERAVLSFTWRFKGLPSGRTCLTQKITLEGGNAAAYLAEIEQAFTSGLVAGLNRIAAGLDRAYVMRNGTEI